MSEKALTTDRLTPGPWEMPNAPYIESKTGEGAMFSNGDWNIYPPMGESGPVAVAGGEADARLIAAAPELLHELKRLYRAYVSLLETGKERIEFFGGTCDSVETMERGDPNLRKAREIIAKAEGRS